jgi:hypothetical protein
MRHTERGKTKTAAYKYKSNDNTTKRMITTMMTMPTKRMVAMRMSKGEEVCDQVGLHANFY